MPAGLDSPRIMAPILMPWLRAQCFDVWFDRPWREFCKTLHPQRELDEEGRYETRRWRATALAEVFFTEEALVDVPLHTEYFKHLPGILTGLGIIGTFRSLIEGLSNLLPSLEPSAMQEALNALIGVVATGFLTSATAILLAIVFTLVEKLLRNACYRKVQAIQQAVDRMFRSGASEEYLERIVTASETSAAQAVQIKDSLVSDLKQILSDVAERQAEVAARVSRDGYSHVSDVVTQRLSGPMDHIAEAVRVVGLNHGESIQRMLADVLAQLSGEIHHVLGGKMNGISEMLAQTTLAMQENAATLKELATSAVASANHTSDALIGELNRALAQIGDRQGLIVGQIDDFLYQLKDSICKLQADSAERQLEAISGLGSRMAAIVHQIHDAADNRLQRQREESAIAINDVADQARALASEREQLMYEMREMTRALNLVAASLRGAADDASARMASGAEALYMAAAEFAKVGERVTATVAVTGTALDRVHAAANLVSGSMEMVAETVSGYREGRDAFAQIIDKLIATADSARKESSITSEMVENLRAAATQLGNAGKQSEDYLSKINAVLSKAHASFAENVEKTLSHGNSRFHVELAKAVDLLAAGIRDLENALEAGAVRG